MAMRNKIYSFMQVAAMLLASCASDEPQPRIGNKKAYKK